MLLLWGCPLPDFSDEVVCNDLHYLWIVTHPTAWREEENMKSSPVEVTETVHRDPVC